MRRITLDLLIAILLPLLIGLGLGLVYSWMISPTRVFDSEPIALRADFKDQYRSAIAAAFVASGNLPRAQARLSLLGDSDPIEALNAQAQRTIANGQPAEQADQIAALASALGQAVAFESTSIPATETAIKSVTTFTSTATLPAAPSDIPIQFTETPQPIETQPILSASTPRPTQTPTSTPGTRFSLTGQETLCDANLPEGLLQVMVLNSKRRQIAGAEIIITWDGGEEQFFTGLKPELGNGYADFIMTPDITYTLHLGLGSDIATGLTPPACETTDGVAFLGGIKLTFQQP